jgi:fumarate hydratase class I
VNPQEASALIVIDPSDVIASVADALQYISFYHPPDYIAALAVAYEAEESPAAKDAIAQILTNSRLSAEGHRPICQDTGIVTVFVEWGQSCTLGGNRSLQEVVDEGVRRAYMDPDNPLRASIVTDPAFSRRNTRDNTPCVLHVEFAPGATVHITLAAKGGGSENKAKFAMLNPGDDIVDWVLKTVPTMGAGWCPPGMLGIGIGGTAEQAMLLAKKSLMANIDMASLRARGPATDLERLRVEIFDRVNDLGIGAQGLGGLSTVLDVKVLDWPTHAASKPIALIPNCAATRHVHFALDGAGPARLQPPSLDMWPKVGWKPSPQARRVNLDKLTREDIATWHPGDRLLLNGKLLTGRDAAHKRLRDMLDVGEPLPVQLAGRVIYYVGPVDPVAEEVVGPAGPTTSTRMDGFTPMVLDQGLLAMIGKAERGPSAIEAIKAAGAAYLIAVGGAAYLVSKAIVGATVVAFEDLGMEAIYEFDVRDMPVTVAVDAKGDSVHISGPVHWRAEIERRRAGGGAKRGMAPP